MLQNELVRSSRSSYIVIYSRTNKVCFVTKQTKLCGSSGSILPESSRSSYGVHELHELSGGLKW